MGILVDEEYGSKILKQAAKKQHIFAVPVEASGQTTFKFQHGNKFGQSLIKIGPTFAKALVRYNPDNQADNQIQLKRLKKLSNFCIKNSIRLMIEPLVPPTVEQLKKVGGDQRKYDKKLRPALMTKMVKEFHHAGIEPDVWKVEALETKKAWNDLAKVVRNTRARRAVNIIVLGRGGNRQLVDQWVKTAASSGQVNGFAIGRTIFFKPLEDFRDGKFKKQETVDQIAKNYLHYINLWRKHAKNKINCVCPKL
jgi:5-dehydro-2-deoxygluconokinase